MSADAFTILIGSIVHNCGVLELFTDNAIAAFIKDPILVPEIRRFPFARRIEILRTLLLREDQRFDPTKVNALCKDLREIAKERNAVAHNVVYADDEHGANQRIVVRHRSNSAKDRELTQSMLEAILKRVREAMAELDRLVPESRYSKN